MGVALMAEMSIRQFVNQEMKHRQISSAREFARQSGIHPRIINDIRNEKYRALEIDTLAKLSEFTGTSLLTLLAMVYPDAAKLDIDLDARLDAERISKLPPNKQAIARGYIADAYTQGDDE